QERIGLFAEDVIVRREALVPHIDLAHRISPEAATFGSSAFGYLARQQPSATKPTSTASQSVAKRTRIIALVEVAPVTPPRSVSCSSNAPSVMPKPPGIGINAPAKVAVA